MLAFSNSLLIRIISYFRVCCWTVPLIYRSCQHADSYSL